MSDAIANRHFMKRLIVVLPIWLSQTICHETKLSYHIFYDASFSGLCCIKKQFLQNSHIKWMKNEHFHVISFANFSQIENVWINPFIVSPSSFFPKWTKVKQPKACYQGINLIVIQQHLYFWPLSRPTHFQTAASLLHNLIWLFIPSSASITSSPTTHAVTSWIIHTGTLQVQSTSVGHWPFCTQHLFIWGRPGDHVWNWDVLHSKE